MPESFASERRALTALESAWKLAYANRGEQCRLCFHVSERKGLAGLTVNYITNNDFEMFFP